MKKEFSPLEIGILADCLYLYEEETKEKLARVNDKLREGITNIEGFTVADLRNMLQIKLKLIKEIKFKFGIK